MLSETLHTEYERLQNESCVVTLEDWSVIQFEGNDRRSFLHNLCTNKIKELEDGTGCEVFVTNVQGKTIGFGYVLAIPDKLLLITAPSQGEFLANHFERYHIVEDVTITDRSKELTVSWIAGAANIPDLADLPSRAVSSEEGTATFYRADLTEQGDYLAVASAEQQSAVSGLGTHCSYGAFEVARIETGLPVFGQDIDDRNLPQEVDRNESAISFTKGCYIGQETVARLDALGHVNWLLRCVSLESAEGITVPCELQKDGKTAFRLTSQTWSPKLQQEIALGYVRHDSADVGTSIPTDHGTLTVITPPGAANPM